MGTSSLVQTQKCIFCTIAFWDYMLSNGTGAAEWTFRPGSSI